jgi:hypothetical protein
VTARAAALVATPEVVSLVDLLIALLAAMGGYFAVATGYQVATGGDVGRMFGGSRVEVALQVGGALGGLLLAVQLLG